MTRTEQVIERAMAAVAESKAARARALERRRQTLGRIDIARKPEYLMKRGVQLQLQLDS